MPARYKGWHFFLLLHVNVFIMNNIKKPLLRLAMPFIAVIIAITSFAFINEGDPRGDGDEKLRMNEIKARAARDFADRCPGIENEKWYRYSTGFSAKFSRNQVLNNVYYDRMGF